MFDPLFFVIGSSQNKEQTEVCVSTYFIAFGVSFPLSIWEFNSSLSFHVNLLYNTVTKHAFFRSIWVQVLNGLIRKYDFLCPITVVLLNLFAEWQRSKVDGTFRNLVFNEKIYWKKGEWGFQVIKFYIQTWETEALLVHQGMWYG